MAMFTVINSTTATTAAATTTIIDGDTRLSPLYWLSGNGGWRTLWECTGHDTWLAVAATISNLWLCWEYCKYAHNCNKACMILPDGALRRHTVQLRKVFLQGAALHVGVWIMLWWLSAYWVLVVMLILHARQTRQLNKIKLQLLHTQEMTYAAEVYAGVITPVSSTQPAVHDRLDQARDQLMQRVP